jgi:hypothetical protein
MALKIARRELARVNAGGDSIYWDAGKGGTRMDGGKAGADKASCLAVNHPPWSNFPPIRIDVSRGRRL